MSRFNSILAPRSPMRYCLNLVCSHPYNADDTKFCQTCGTKLLLANRYGALKLLGRGGFGRTLLAADELIPSKPPCVIKQFLPEQLSPAQLDKATALFQAEAIRLDQLGQHPQIPRLLAHCCEAGYRYLVLTYVEGQTLEQELAATGAFSEAQIRHLLESLLPVLQFIHDHQVIHRDIKPDNILRRQSDRALVLVDFGASKLATGSSLGKTGTVIGSAGYAAPEQAAGKAVFASDLYSLGVTCIHLLTNVDPFDLYSFSDGAWVWRDFLPQPVSPELAAILDRLLEPSLNRRYSSASAVLQALQPSPALPAASLAPLPLLQPAALPPATWKSTQVLTGHLHSIAALAISPNGKILASSSFDKTIKLWHLETGTLIANLEGHRQPVTALVFTANGQILISGSLDRSIKLWHVHTASLLSTLTEQVYATLSLSIALTADEQAIVTGSDDGKVQLWHFHTGKRFRTLQHPRGVTSIALSPEGDLLATGSSDDQVRIWDIGSGELLYMLEGHTRDVNAVAIDTAGEILISSSSDSKIKAWQLKTGQPLGTLTGHLDWVNDIAIRSQDRLLASASSDHTIRLWDLSSKKRLFTLTDHEKAVNVVKFSSDGATLVSGSADRTIRIWRCC